MCFVYDVRESEGKQIVPRHPLYMFTMQKSVSHLKKKEVCIATGHSLNCIKKSKYLRIRAISVLKN